MSIKVAFLEGRLLSSQSQLLKSFQKALIGWIKPDPPKSHFVFGHVNRLYGHKSKYKLHEISID